MCWGVFSLLLNFHAAGRPMLAVCICSFRILEAALHIWRFVSSISYPRMCWSNKGSTYTWHESCVNQNRSINQKADENCPLLGYYAASSGNLPITTTRCMMSQKSAFLICFAAEAWNHAKGRRYLRKASVEMDKRLKPENYLIFLVSAEVTNAVFFKEFVIIFLG